MHVYGRLEISVVTPTPEDYSPLWEKYTNPKYNDGLTLSAHGSLRDDSLGGRIMSTLRGDIDCFRAYWVKAIGLVVSGGRRNQFGFYRLGRPYARPIPGGSHQQVPRPRF